MTHHNDVGEVELDAVWGYREYGTPSLMFSAGATPFPPFASSWAVNASEQWPSQSWKGFNVTGQSQLELTPTHFVLSYREDTDGVQGPHPCPLGSVASCLIYADVRLHIPVAHNNGAGSPRVRYLTVQMLAPSNIVELVIYGTRVDANNLVGAGAAPAAAAPARGRPTMRQMMGVNVFADDPIERIKGLTGTAREYQEWTFTEGE